MFVHDKLNRVCWREIEKVYDWNIELMRKKIIFKNKKI